MKTQVSSARLWLHRFSAGLLFAGILAAGLLVGLLPVSDVSAVQQETKLSPSAAKVGQDLFRAWCRSCHGPEGEGDGPVAEHLRVPPADLTMLSARNDGHFDFDGVVAKIDGREKVPGHGSEDMPVWGDAFVAVDEEEGEDGVQKKIEYLAHFIWSIQAEADKSEP